MASPLVTIQPASSDFREILEDSKRVIVDSASNELIFAVVGHVGSGTTFIADALVEALSQEDLVGGSPYETSVIKARGVIEDWAASNARGIPASGDRRIDASISLQNYGDEMRSRTTSYGEDHSAVARGMIARISSLRATMMGKEAEFKNDEDVVPDGKRRAFILDALRHPAEVHLLRKVYQEAFVLIGVVCEEDKRRGRISKKYKNAGEDDAQDFMDRDAKGKKPYGQRVTDAFHLADYFVDNTEDRVSRPGQSNPTWRVLEKINRLVKVISHSQIIRPDPDETAMHHANAAMMESACLSRQVGAALVDKNGNLLSTGTNEVPKSGGGVYGEPRSEPSFPLPKEVASAVVEDSRCAYRADSYCSNTREQGVIIDALIKAIPELEAATQERKKSIAETISDTKVGSLLEFSRAVHAEMDALLSAGRTGSSTVGTKLFVTTFPCHYCARHIVSAGVTEVQFIEPYPKSLAMKLHNDSITIIPNGIEHLAGAVLFRPFSGVAPRMYKRAFLKDRELKDKKTGKRSFAQPDWGNQWQLNSISYIEIEKKLARIDGDRTTPESEISTHQESATPIS